MHEESKIERLRRLITEQYETNPTGAGGSFGEILCYEIHANGLTFLWLAEKWGVTVTTLGELIHDHCKRLEAEPIVNHKYIHEAQKKSQIRSVIQNSLKVGIEISFLKEDMNRIVRGEVLELIRVHDDELLIIVRSKETARVRRI